MAVLTKIRNRAGLLVFFIGLSLVAFLLMDALNSNSSLLQGSNTSNVIAEINGKPVTYQEFEQKYNEAVNSYKISQNKSTLDDQTLQYIREQTWNQFVKDNILSEEYEELGIDVTSDELYDLVQGPNPHPSIRQAFTDPNTGQFQPNNVLQYLKQMDNDPSGDSRKRWLSFEEYIQEDRLTNKYTNMVKKGIYLPKKSVEQAYVNQNKTVSIDFIKIPYSSISDSAVKVTDDDLQDYLENNSKKYWRDEEVRSVQYVLFEVIPSQKDSASIQKYIQSEIANFKETENDTSFLKLYSDNPYTPKYYNREELSGSTFSDTLFNVESGVIVGPYYEDGYYKAAKIIDKKLIPDSVKASHILFTVNQNQDPSAVLKLADSVKALADSGLNFTGLAIEYSEDKQTKIKGGDLGWIKPDEMFATMNNALFYDTKQGDIVKIYSPQGIHIVKIEEATPATEGVKVAFLTKKIVSGMDTERELFAAANEFASENRKLSDFEKSIETQNLIVRKAENIKQNDNAISGIAQARSFVKWVYDNEEDEVSNVIELGDKFAVAVVTDIKEEGLISLEEVRGEIEVKVMQEKKFAMLKDQLQDKASDGKDLQQIAAAFNQNVQKADGISFSSSFIPGAGNEPKVIGTALGLKQDQVSKPVQGNSGLFIIKVTNITEAGEIANYKFLKKQTLQPIVATLDYSLFNALKENAEIADNRSKFY